MKVKYHKKPNGKIGICNAYKRNCPYEQTSEFDLKPSEKNSFGKALNVYSKAKADFDYIYNESKVDEIYSKEPEISKQISSIKDIKLEGFEFRLKSKASIKEKIEVRKDNKNVDEMFDIVRYTSLIDKTLYINEYKRILSELLQKNFEVIQIKNFWVNESGYKGINCKLSYKGTKLEIQFHTPESLKAKEKAHLVYEERRLLDKIKDKDEIDKLDNLMENIFREIPSPYLK